MEASSIGLRIESRKRCFSPSVDARQIPSRFALRKFKMSSRVKVKTRKRMSLTFSEGIIINVMVQIMKVAADSGAIPRTTIHSSNQSKSLVCERKSQRLKSKKIINCPRLDKKL